MMKQAEELTRSGDLKGAEQKYQFAILIKQDGPGQPQERLREVQAAEAQAASAKPAPPPSQPVPVETKTTLPSKTNNDQKKNKLRDAQRLKSSQVAALKVEETSGGKTTPGSIKRDPEEVIKSLTQGITDFYASHFSHADDAIEVYLRGDGSQYAGAAHFYLGASLLMQTLLTSPKDGPRTESLRQQARDQFVAAKQLHYEPLESAVSPKVFSEWIQIGNQQ